jgi:hypothetical protein
VVDYPHMTADQTGDIGEEHCGRGESGGQRTEDGGRRSEDRGQRTEDRGRRSEDRGRNAAGALATSNESEACLAWP